MSKCTDPVKGQLLHAYELDALSEEDKERFEIHLLECEYCYNELNAFEEEAALLRSAEEVKDLVREAITEDEPVPTLTPQTVWGALWPKKPLILRPALAYLVILLLIVPAFLWLRGPEKEGARRVQIVNFYPDLSPAESVFRKSAGDAGVISFVFRGAVPGEDYRVIIQYEDGPMVFEDEAFDGFDESETGWLLVPLAEMAPGQYRLVITDPRAEPPLNLREYRFKVEK